MGSAFSATSAPQIEACSGGRCMGPCYTPTPSTPLPHMVSIASRASKPCLADTPCQLLSYHSRPQKRNLTSVYSVHKQYLPCRLLSDCKTRKADNHLPVALATKDALAGGAHSCQDEGFAALANYRRCPPGGDEQTLGLLVRSARRKPVASWAITELFPQ